MKAFKLALILTIATATMTGLMPAEQTIAKENTNTKYVVKGNNEFAFQLYARLRGKEGNLFFSPYSISTALALTYSGARGQTESQMSAVLHFPIFAKKNKQALLKD